MPREHQAWELCERNALTGLHNWFLEHPPDETGKKLQKGGKTAFCHVCRAQPPYFFRHDVERKLKDMVAAARRGW